MRFLRIACILVLIGILGAAAAGTGAYFWAERYIRTPSPLAIETDIVIPEGSSIRQIAELLTDTEILTYPLAFEAILRLRFSHLSLQAGQYRFSPGTTPQEVWEKLSRGDTIVYSITIPEGLTSRQILELIAAAPNLSGDIPGRIPPEGTLLPETYNFHYQDSRISLIERMEGDMATLVIRLWANRAKNLPLRTPQEAVTLASIVEKETGLKEERGRVASVFINRLRQGIRLQSDPTVIYGITLGKNALERSLRMDDLQNPTPYNTYTIDRLPPTPIANPGRAALEAVMNPPNTKDLYFVADGTGGHVFAGTLEAHQRNVLKWRRIQRETRRKQNQAKP